MPFRGIKINIAVNIAIILLVAMLLTNIVVVITVHKNLTREEVYRGFRLITMLENHLPHGKENATAANLIHLTMGFEEHLRAMGASCGAIALENGKTLPLGQENCASFQKLGHLTQSAMTTGQRRARIKGSVWSVFLGKSREMLIAAPLRKHGRIVAAGGIARRIEYVHDALRQSQKVVLGYIVINILVFTFLGLYRISRFYVDPVKRLARRAEVYKEEDGVYFPIQKEGNEIKSLTKALNSMVERISEDKKALRKTVRSLERANQELASAQKEIIRAEKLASVGRLSSGIAHEIGNPIGIVLGYLELLKQDDLTDDEKSEYLGRSEDEINRISKIIRQLLDFSRPSTDGMTTVSVHEIISGVVEVIRVQPFMSRINLNLDLKAEKDHVHADPDQLKQIFLNLAINAADAIKAREEGLEGELTIQSENEPGPRVHENGPSEADGESSGILKIMCIDNGVGVPEENLENIFDPFFTTKEPGKGTGLGLAVSYTIIEGIGGAIEADSEKGRGATITLRLPLTSKNA
ncbi:MAG: hypothetical protein GY859_34615 [Desulfobacterales bacterium]|nr:hypothetical protein [Desulfobacterales bacterium]